MTYQEVYQKLSSITVSTTTTDTIPVAYLMFPEDPNNPAPPPPFITYHYPGDNDLIADNINYQPIRQLTVELYCDNKDFVIEKAVEDVLTSNGFVYSKSEEYIDSEKLYETIYETEVVITNG